MLLIVNGVCKERFEKNIWNKESGSGERRMNERCTMADAVTSVLHQVQLALFFEAGAILPIACLWHVLSFCCIGSASFRLRQLEIGLQIPYCTSTRVCLTSKRHSCFRQPDVVFS